MKKNAIRNIFASGFEKAATLVGQFLTAMLVIRFLPRELYGNIGVVNGYLIFFSVLNIALENVLLRDFQKIRTKIDTIMFAFLCVSILKSLLFVVLGFGLGALLGALYPGIAFRYSIVSALAILVADTAVSPFVVLSGLQFRQHVVTVLSIVRSALSLLLTCGLMLWPNLQYIAVRDLLVSMVYASLWFVESRKLVNYKNIRLDSEVYGYIKKTICSYSIWTHLNNIATNLIYKSDVVFLSLFVGLAAIGDYNIALSCANIANIVPMVLGLQTSIVLSRSQSHEDANRTATEFLVLTAFAGAMVVVGYLVLGDTLLGIITGASASASMKKNMMLITVGLMTAKAIGSPLAAFIMARGSVVNLVLRVTVPISVVTCTAYYVGARAGGARGAAYANVVIGAIWMGLMLLESHRQGYRFRRWWLSQEKA